MIAFRAKKRLGQNFLESREHIDKIIDAISPGPGDTIVEIGSGRGALTVPLVESGATILAVEFDAQLCGYLEKLLKNKENVTVLEMDFLQFFPAEYGLKSFKLCGNLPFNISSPVIDWIVQHRASIKRAVIMIQKEVALRLSSHPGGKDWSPLAIMTQLYFDIRILFNVPPQYFRPSPEVTSSVVELTPKVETEIENFDKFEELVRASFKQRRKLLLNNLVPVIIPTVIAAEEIFQQMGLGRNTRAEEVTTAQFLELTALLNKRRMF